MVSSLFCVVPNKISGATGHSSATVLASLRAPVFSRSDNDYENISTLGVRYASAVLILT